MSDLIKLIEFQVFGDKRGSLIALESNKNIPFEIKRTYCIFDTKKDVSRGFHAHRNLQQIAVCLIGQCRMVLDDGKNREEIWLNSPTKGVYIGKYIWREMHDFSEDCVLMVLADQYFDTEDYIRDYLEFKRISNMIVESKTVRLRLVQESDANFILKLRLDDKYNKYLSKVAGSLDAQIQWIRSYKKQEIKEEQFYFIIENHDGTPCGTVRIYDFKGDSFSWGSWILNEDKTRYASLESAFLVYDFGFNYLDMKKAHFDVMKGNDTVISFHERMGAYRTSEDSVNVYFEITKEIVNNSKEKLKYILV